MSSYSRQQLEDYLKTINVKGSVLDIGGSQNPITKRVKSWNVDKYEILDLPNPHEGASKPDIEADIQCDLVIAKELFDVAFCIEVSEYWIDPVKALTHIGLLLKKDGILYISFHFIYPVHEPRGEDCLRYTRYGIEKLMKASGFEIEEITTREILSDITGFYNKEGMRGLNKNRDNIHQEQGYICKARRL